MWNDEIYYDQFQVLLIWLSAKFACIYFINFHIVTE